MILDRPSRRLELRPFETAVVYEKMEFVDPTPETPIGTYTPLVAERINLDECDQHFKPGFCAQARSLSALVRSEDPGPAARLEDAFKVLKLAEELIGGTFGSHDQD